MHANSYKLQDKYNCCKQTIEWPGNWTRKSYCIQVSLHLINKNNELFIASYSFTNMHNIVLGIKKAIKGSFYFLHHFNRI